jgi:hypothetical protein
MHCGAEADVEVDGQACGQCGMEIPLVFGNVDLQSMGAAAPGDVSVPAPPPMPDSMVPSEAMPVPPSMAASLPSSMPAPAGPRASQMPAPLHTVPGLELELTRRPNQNGAVRGRALAAGMRRAAEEPVVQSTAWGRALILMLLLVGAWFVYSSFD